MKNFFSVVLDFLFPPTQEALALRALSPERALIELTPALPSPFPFITALFSYKDPLVTELVLSIKNKKDRHAFACAGYALFQKLQSLGLENAVLVPIPISEKRRRERGYNQCELLIDAVLEYDSEQRFMKNTRLLMRPRHTADQKTKNRDERLHSSAGIFEVVGPPFPTPIIVIDDVATTGVTLREARQVLLKAGFARVSALSLAH